MPVINIRKGILKNESNFDIQGFIETRASSNFQLRTLTCSLFYLFKGVLRHKRPHHGHCSPVLCCSWHWIDVFCSSRWVLLLFCILYLLWPYHTLGTKGFFFLKCDVCGEILVGLKADTSSARAEATGYEATRKWWPLFLGNKPDFCACFSLNKTWPKAETAQGKPLAPRVTLPTLLCMFYPKNVWPSLQSPRLIFCPEARF